MHVVGRHQRQAACIGEVEQRTLDAPLTLLAVALQLDIEPAVEQRLQTLELMGRGRHLTRRQQAADAAAHAADQGQQALGIALQLGRAAAPAASRS